MSLIADFPVGSWGLQ